MAYQNEIVQLYPVPSSSQLHFNYRSSVAGVIGVQLINPAGIMEKQYWTNANSGISSMEIDTHLLPAGNYFLIVTDTGIKINYPFTKMEL